MAEGAPAGNASSISGKLSAASTSATIDGSAESEAINQPAPTSCIQDPTFATIVAIHRLRKSAFCNGLQGERAGGDGLGPRSGADGAAFIACPSLVEAAPALGWRGQQLRSRACLLLVSLPDSTRPRGRDLATVARLHARARPWPCC